MKRFSLANSLSTMGLVFSVITTGSQAEERVAERAAARDLRAVNIRYAGSGLATPEGVQALYAKLERASRQACRRVDGRDLRARTDARACRNAALDAAVAGVQSVGLSALHRERSGARGDAALVAAVADAHEAQ